MPVRALVAIDIHALNIGTESALFPLSWENYLMCFDLTDWQPRIASSVHEAAHAIVADRLGVPVDVVLISVDGNGGGETRAPSTDVRHEIQIALAGGIAEYRYCDAVGYPEDKGRHPYWGQLSDKERLFKAARLALNDDAVAARNLVEELRPMVVAMIGSGTQSWRWRSHSSTTATSQEAFWRVHWAERETSARLGLEMPSDQYASIKE